MEVDLDEGGADTVLEKTQNKTANTVLRFHPAFWAAFRKPLDKSKSRFMSDHVPVRFMDSASLQTPHGFVEVEREYIVGPDADFFGFSKLHRTGLIIPESNQVSI